MTQVVGQFKYSPEAAHRRLSDFIDHAPELDTYEVFTKAVYCEHELPLAIASLYQHFGAPLQETGSDLPLTYGFFQQTGTKQIKGTVGPNPNRSEGGPFEVKLIQSRPRIIRDPRIIRMAVLSVTTDPGTAPFDATYDYQKRNSTLFAAHNTRGTLEFIDRVKNQGADLGTMQRALTSGFVTDPEESRSAIGSASETLRKLSQGLLSVTGFEAVE